MQKRKGIVFVISAPSGAGKTTLIDRLLREFSTFTFSISYTTREPRPSEVDGVHYHFITEKEFLVLKDHNFFAEWALVHGSYYGTPIESTKTLLEKGRDIIFDIDVQGAKQLQSVFTNGIYVFILPPSYEILHQRLLSRNTDDEETIQRRMHNASVEIESAHWFSAWIVNDSLEKAYDELRAVYISATLSPSCNSYLLESIRKEWKF